MNAATGDQTTRYVYGSTLASSYVARSDLLVAEIYPDSDDSPFDDGDDAVPDRIEYTYNRQGQRKSRRDQNGTLRGFLFDKLGRLVHDYVEVLAPGVDGRVRRITREYGCASRLKTISAYTHPCARTGAVASQVAFGYNGQGLLSAEYQSHAGPVDMLATSKVQYGYDDTAESGELVKGLRPTRVVYPSGRVVRYEYGESAGSSSSGAGVADPDDCLNRVKFIADDDDGEVGTHLAEYQYLGLGSIVTEAYPEPRVKLDYTPDGYSGFDRFGRVIDHCWRNYATGQDLDRNQYAHDRAGNRTSRRNATTTERDEHYLYDGLYRLVRADRGNLDPAMHRIAGTPERQESWWLDPTGNWNRHQERESGRLTHDQSRQHNRANELLSFSCAVGDPWSNPAHDRNGNMTRIPKPANPRESMNLRWDAWDRLTKVSDSLGLVAEYQYDPRGFRIASHTYRDPAEPDTVLASPVSRHYYHNARWQVLEERTAGSPTLPFLHYIYSLRYIDAPILRDRRLPGELSPLSERLYYLGDANFNVTALVTPAGSPVERYAYTPYGEPSYLSSIWRSRVSSAFDNTILYTGREFDSASGLAYYRRRYYTTDFGRFLGRDPTGYVAGEAMLYDYVGGSPVRFVDPAGLQTSWSPYPGSGPYLAYHPGKGSGAWGRGEAAPSVEQPFPKERRRISTSAVVALAHGTRGMHIFVTFGDLKQWPSLRALYLRQAGLGIKGSSNFKEMLDSIRQRLPGDANRASRDKCLGFLEINTHGNPHTFKLHDIEEKGAPVDDDRPIPESNEITWTNAEWAAAELAKLPWCCECLIAVTACNTGLAKDSFLRVIGDRTGCTVVAPAGYSSGSIHNSNARVTRARRHNAYVGFPRETAHLFAAEDDKWHVFDPVSVTPSRPGTQECQD